KTTHRGALIGTIYMIALGVFYYAIPNAMASPFVDDSKTEWTAVAPLIPLLLRFVAIYSLADGANIIYAFALRGAGDTRFVTLLAIGLSWPIMVIPTWFSVERGWGIEAAWSFATAYVIALAIAFLIRFLGGKWRTMKVIEPHVAE